CRPCATQYSLVFDLTLEECSCAETVALMKASNSLSGRKGARAFNCVQPARRAPERGPSSTWTRPIWSSQRVTALAEDLEYPSYSDRSAMTGSTRVARRAG